MFSIPSILLVSVGSVFLSMLGFLVARKFVKPINFDEHLNFLDAMLSVVGTLVSILLGLLVASSLQRYQDLQRIVEAESTSTSEVFRLARGLPDEDRKKIQDTCKNYCELVISEEWPAMAKGHVSPLVLRTYGRLVDEVVRFAPKDNRESNIHQAMINSMLQMGNGRRERKLALNNTWSQLLMPVLLCCSAIVLAFAYIYARRGTVLHAIVISFVALALGGNLGLVFLLSTPFQGEWKIQPTGFQLNLRIIKELEHSPGNEWNVDGNN